MALSDGIKKKIRDRAAQSGQASLNSKTPSSPLSDYAKSRVEKLVYAGKVQKGIETNNEKQSYYQKHKAEYDEYDRLLKTNLGDSSKQSKALGTQISSLQKSLTSYNDKLGSEDYSSAKTAMDRRTSIGNKIANTATGGQANVYGDDYAAKLQEQINALQEQRAKIDSDIGKASSIQNENKWYTEIPQSKNYSAVSAVGLSQYEEDQNTAAKAGIASAKNGNTAADYRASVGYQMGKIAAGDEAVEKTYKDKDKYANDAMLDLYSEQQKQIFGYLYATDKAEAEKFREQTNREIMEQQKQADIQSVYNWAGDNNIAAGVLGTAAYLGSGIDAIRDYSEIAETGKIAPNMGITELSQALRQPNSELIAEKTPWANVGDVNVMSRLYEMIPSAVQSFIGAKSIGALGLTGTKMEKAIGSFFVEAPMAAQSAASSIDEAIARGVEPQKAAQYGILAGINEAIGENVSLEGLIKLNTNPKTFSKWLLGNFRQAGFEGLEEVETTILNTYADEFVNGGYSEINSKIKEYTANGMTQDEAAKSAWNDWSNEVAWDFIGGAVLGFAGGTAQQVNIKTNSAAADLGAKSRNKAKARELVAGIKSVDELNSFVEAGLKSKQGTQSRKIAEEIRRKESASRKAAGSKTSVKNKDVAYESDYVRLGVALLSEQDSESVTNLFANEIMRQSKKQGSEITYDEAKNQAQTLAKSLKGEFLTEKENAILAGSPAAEKTYANATGINYETGDIEQREKVDSSTVKKILSTDSDGGIKIELNDGRQVYAEDVDLSGSAEILNYSGGLSTNEARVMLGAYELYLTKAGDNRISAEEFAVKYSEMYELGTTKSVPFETAAEELELDEAEKSILKEAYVSGTAATAQSAAKAQSKIDSLKKKSKETSPKKGSVRALSEKEAAGFGYDWIKAFDTKSANTDKQVRAATNFCRGIAEATGINIVLYETNGEQGANGWYDRKTNTIYLDVNAGYIDSRSMLRTLSHELTHFMQQMSPAKYQEYKDFIIDFYNEKNPGMLNGFIITEAKRNKGISDSEMAKYLDEVKAKNPGITDEELLREQNIMFLKTTRLSESLLIDEVVADASEMMLKDSSAIEQIVKEHRGVAEIISKWFKRIINALHTAFEGVKAKELPAMELEKSIEAFEAAQKMWDAMFAESVSTYQQIGSNAVSKETKDGTNRQFSFSSMGYSFYGNENITAEDFENGGYKSKQGYKDYVNKALNIFVNTHKGVSKSDAKKEIVDSIDGIVKVAVAAKKAGYDILDDATKRGVKDSKGRLLFSSLEPNSDYFTSNDISTICDKRKNFGEIYNEIVRIETQKGVPEDKRFFRNVDNFFMLHNVLADKGLTQPCRDCFVESMRKNLAPMANAFLTLIRETDPNNINNEQLYQLKGRDKGRIKSNNAALRERVLDTLKDYNMTADDISIETLTTSDGLAQLKIQAPLIYEAFNSFYGQSKPKMPKEATPFRFGELMALLIDDNGNLKKSRIDTINATGGFRLQSYSDFQIQNYVDVLQVIFEAGVIGLNGHAYTKVPAFLDCTDGTNLKRNVSIFMYKDGTEWKLDKNDSFPATSMEDLYSIVNSDKTGNTSVIAVSQNEDMSSYIMANDNIGFGIPFHKSGNKMATVRNTVVHEDGRDILGYTGTKDHTKQQTEVWKTTADGHKAFTKVHNMIDIYSFWDFDNADGLSKNELIKKNLKNYIDACDEKGYLPIFREYVMKNENVLNMILKYARKLGYADDSTRIEDISFKYKGYTIPYGYYKFVGDFGMFTPDGKASPHKILSLKDYNFIKAAKLFENAETLRRNEILQQFANGEVRQKYRESSLTTEQLKNIIDEKRSEIANAVVNRQFSNKDSEGNILSEAQQEFFKDSKIRDSSGNLLKMYHGTKADFTVFEREKIGSTGRFEGAGFNFTPSESRAASYGGNVLGGYLNITNPLSVQKKTISRTKLAALIRGADPTGDNIIVDYAKDTRDYGKNSFVQRESFTAANNIWEASDNDVDIYSYISAADPDAESLIAIFQKLGYDGLLHFNDDGKIKTAVAFNSNQFKSADNQNPSLNDDIRYSQRDTEYLELAKNPDDNAVALQRMVQPLFNNYGEIHHITVSEAAKYFANKVYETLMEVPNVMQFGIRFDNRLLVPEDSFPNSHELFQDPEYDDNNELVYPKGVGFYEDFYDAGELEGTSVLGFVADSDTDLHQISNIIEKYLQAMYDGKYVYLVSGENVGIGYDDGEALLKRPKVISVLCNFNGNIGKKVIYTNKSSAPVTYDKNGGIIPLSERFKDSNDDIRYSQKDSEYLELAKDPEVNSIALQSMVAKAAREAGYNSKKLYHGTDKFGFTRFADGLIFTSENHSISAGYTHNKGYARKRLTSQKYIQDDGTIETLIKNAKNILEQNYHQITKDEQSQIKEKFRKSSSELSEKVNNVWTGDAIDAIPYTESLSYTDEDGFEHEAYFEDAIAYVLNIPTEVSENIDSYGEEQSGFYDTVKSLKDSVRKFNLYHPVLREYLIEHREEIKGTPAEGIYDIVTGFDLSDFVIDVEYKLLRSLNSNYLINPTTGSVSSPNVIRKNIEGQKDLGSYSLYGKLGDKPLVIDANGSMWTDIKVDVWEKDKYFTTDAIGERAKKEGYTSVEINDIYDMAMNDYSSNEKATIYIFFNPNDLKSADPITYDENGNIIPLSERFKENNPDIRFSNRGNGTDTTAENNVKYQYRDEDQNRISILNNQEKRIHDSLAAFEKAYGDTIRKAYKDNFSSSEQISEQSKEIIGKEVTRFTNEIAEMLYADSQKAQEATEKIRPLVEELAEKGPNAYDDVIEKLARNSYNSHNAGYYEQYADEELRKQVAKEIRESTIRLERQYSDAEPEEWRRFTKRLRIRKDEGTSLAKFYSEMANLYPTIIDATEESPRGMLENLYNVFEPHQKEFVDLSNAMSADEFVSQTIESLNDSAYKFFSKSIGTFLKDREQNSRRRIRGIEATNALDDIINTARTADKAAEYARAEGVLAGQIEQGAEDAKALRIKEEQFQKKISEFEKQIETKKLQIKEIRDKKNEIIQNGRIRTTELLKAQREKRNDTARKKAIRSYIIANVRRIDSMLRNPSDMKHIPENLRSAVIAFGECFTENSSVFSLSVLDRINTEYRKMAADTESTLRELYDDDIMDDLDSLKETLEGKRLSELSATELAIVKNIVENFKFIIKEGNSVFVDGKRQMINDLAGRVIENAKDKKKLTFWNNFVGDAAHFTAKFLGVDMMTPVYMFDFIGGPIKSLFNDMLNDGTYQYSKDLQVADKFIINAKEKYNFSSWYDGKERLSFETSFGEAIDLSVREALGIYATYKREMSSNGQEARHLSLGGFVYENEKEHGGDRNTHPLSTDDFKKIFGWLTDDQKNFANTIVQFLSTTVSSWGNRTSMGLHGYKKFNEKYYFPYRVAGEYLHVDLDKLDGNQTARIKNKGMTKALVKGANKPVLIGDFMSTVTNHISDMIVYDSFAIAQDNFMRLYNFITPPSEGVKAQSVQQILINTYGNKTNGYIKDLLRQIAGGITKDTTENVGAKLTSLFKKGAVLANASVIIQQPSAIGRAMAYLDPQDFASKPLSVMREYSEALEYSGSAYVKSMGRFDMATGRTASQWLNRDRPKILNEKLKAFVRIGKDDTGYRDDVLGSAAQYADEITWARIWLACKQNIRRQYPQIADNREAFLKLAGKKFDDVINHTQVYDSIFTKSALMRSQNGITQMATAFMAEPTLSFNMYADLIKRSIYGEKINAQKWARTLGAVILSQVLNSFLKGIVGALRDDDEDKTYIEKYLEKVSGNIVDSIAPWNNIPFVKDAVSIFNGYDVSRSDITVIADFKSAIDKLDNSDKSIWEKAEGLSSALNLIGLPIKNISRDIRSIFTTLLYGKPISETSGIDIYLGLWDSIGLSAPEIAAGAKAYSSGDTKAYGQIVDGLVAQGADRNTVIAAIRKKAGAKKSGSTLLQDDLYDNSDVYSAMDSGNSAKIKSVCKEVVKGYVNSGKTEKEAKSLLKGNINGHFKPLYIEASSSERTAIRKAMFATGLYDSADYVVKLCKGWTEE